MDEKYALLTTTTLALLAVRFRLNLNKPGALDKITGEALIDILNILEQSMYETEQEIHKLYESREEGDKKDA